MHHLSILPTQLDVTLISNLQAGKLRYRWLGKLKVAEMDKPFRILQLSNRRWVCLAHRLPL